MEGVIEGVANGAESLEMPIGEELWMELFEAARQRHEALTLDEGVVE